MDVLLRGILNCECRNLIGFRVRVDHVRNVAEFVCVWFVCCSSDGWRILEWRQHDGKIRNWNGNRFGVIMRVRMEEELQRCYV